MTWYVVFRGRNPGVYKDWQTCNEQVCGYSNCSFRGYATKAEAVANYHAYFAVGAEPSTQNFGQIQEIQAAPALFFQEPAAAGADAGLANAAVEPPAPGADPNLLSVVFILVGVLIALVGYILNQ